MVSEAEAAPAWLRAEVVTLAWCWRLSRRDGVVLGLTSHDRDLLIDGVPYRAAPGMKPSAIETSDSLDASTMDLEGAISSDAIAARDLDAGRWDGAALTLFVTDWTAPEVAPVTVARGTLGAIERRGSAFAAELQGIMQMLDRPVCPATSPSCRAALGDPACRINLAPLTHARRIVAIDERQVTIDAARGADARRDAATASAPARAGAIDRGVRQAVGDLSQPLCQCGQFPRRGASAGQ